MWAADATFSLSRHISMYFFLLPFQLSGSQSMRWQFPRQSCMPAAHGRLLPFDPPQGRVSAIVLYICMLRGGLRHQQVQLTVLHVPQGTISFKLTQPLSAFNLTTIIYHPYFAPSVWPRYLCHLVLVISHPRRLGRVITRQCNHCQKAQNRCHVQVLFPWQATRRARSQDRKNQAVQNNVYGVAAHRAWHEAWEVDCHTGYICAWAQTGNFSSSTTHAHCTTFDCTKGTFAGCGRVHVLVDLHCTKREHVAV